MFISQMDYTLNVSVKGVGRMRLKMLGSFVAQQKRSKLGFLSPTKQKQR